MPETKKLSQINHVDNSKTLVETFDDGTHKVKHAQDGIVYGVATHIATGHTHEEVVDQYKNDEDTVTKIQG